MADSVKSGRNKAGISNTEKSQKSVFLVSPSIRSEQFLASLFLWEDQKKIITTGGVGKIFCNRVKTSATYKLLPFQLLGFWFFCENKREWMGLGFFFVLVPFIA